MISHHNVGMVFSIDSILDSLDKRRVQCEGIASAAQGFAQAILDNTLQNPRQQAALRYVDIAMWIALASLGTQGDGG